MTYGDFRDEGGAMNAAETTRQIKALWKSNEEIRGDMKGFRVELVEQGKVLSKIDGNIDRLANAIMMVPPKDQCVRNSMEIQMLKETCADLEEKEQCHGCKSEKEISDLKRWKEETAPRIYMALGALGLIQVLVPVAILIFKH